MSKPTQTEKLEITSAAIPAARLVIQKRYGVTAVARRLIWVVSTPSIKAPVAENEL
jgi:hypothetical protein